jgi:hypothetical protein
MGRRWGLWCSIAILGLLGARQLAHSASIMPVFGVNLPNATIEPTTNFTVKSGPQLNFFGAFLEYQMLPRLTIEGGLLWMKRGFATDVSGTQTVYTFEGPQLPILFRLAVNRVLSFGMGGYAFHAVGNYAKKTGGTTEVRAFGFGDYGRDDTGVAMSVALRFGLGSQISVVLDGRLLYGLQNISEGTGFTTRLYDIQAMAGVKFAL